MIDSHFSKAYVWRLEDVTQVLSHVQNLLFPWWKTTTPSIFRKNGWEVEGNRLETTVLFPKQSSTRYRFNSDV
jgi:methionine salvage enolase-phosphatase E1